MLSYATSPPSGEVYVHQWSIKAVEDDSDEIVYTLNKYKLNRMNPTIHCDLQNKISTADTAPRNKLR